MPVTGQVLFPAGPGRARQARFSSCYETLEPTVTKNIRKSCIGTQTCTQMDIHTHKHRGGACEQMRSELACSCTRFPGMLPEDVCAGRRADEAGDRRVPPSVRARPDSCAPPEVRCRVHRLEPCSCVLFADSDPAACAPVLGFACAARLLALVDATCRQASQ